MIRAALLERTTMRAILLPSDKKRYVTPESYVSIAPVHLNRVGGYSFWTHSYLIAEQISRSDDRDRESSIGSTYRNYGRP